MNYTKEYKPDSYKPDMRDMKIVARGGNGKSKIYLDKRTRRTYNKKQLCDGINNGEIIGGHIRIIKGVETPCKNPRNKN